MTHVADVEAILDMAAANVWAASQGKNLTTAGPNIVEELRKMMKDICFCNHDEARQREYAKYREQNKEAFLMYDEWLAWEKRVNSLRCKVPAE